MTVFMAAEDLGDIYIGAAVQEWSERRVLERIHASLTATGERFVLLANFQLDGRQVDCVVVTARRVIVVEVKASALPVRGQLDGDWARLHVSGQWRQYTNGYRQALGQKERLLDALRAIADVGRFYPDAAVVFAKPLPLGSDLTTGDFKVAVTDLDRFEPAGTGDRPNPWTLVEWLAFATSLSLRRTSLGEVLAGAVLEPAFALMRDYRDRVTSELDRDSERWLSESDPQREELLAALDHAPGFLIAGPSGCGKTLAARWLGNRLSQAGECVIFLAAKDFNGSWGKLLARELALLMDASVPALFRAIRETGCPVRIVLDGVNELGAARDHALRGLRALARRLEARVIVTGQSGPAGQLAGLLTIAIAAPSIDLKQRIAEAQLVPVSASIRSLLNAVTSGFEAAIVAEIGAEAQVGSSRQILADQFIRKRLGSARRLGSAGLRRFAQTLIETTSFSMSETAFDELMASNGLNSPEVDAVFASGIVVSRGGRVSFAHEILLNACAAFAFSQGAAKAGAKFAILLSLPALESIAIDILSVIESEAVMRTILEATCDHTLLFEASQSLAGATAAAVANDLLDQTEAMLAAEIAGLTLVVVAGKRPSVDWDEESLRAWTDAETARISALARAIGTGQRVEVYFELCAAMDARLWDERKRLFDKAAAAGIKALRSDAFQLAYLGFARQSGFAQISRKAASGMFDIVEAARAHPTRDMMTLTSGQLHFYLERRRLFLDQGDVDEVADAVTQVIARRFRMEPYHVKLAILDAARFVSRASPDKVEALVEVIQEIDANRENLWISTSIVEALKSLGGLDESAEEAREGIKAEFARATGDLDDDDVRHLALAASTAMFDHPFDSIYGDEFSSLSPERRHVLMRRAAQAGAVRTSMSLSWVLRQIAEFDDPADHDVMEMFANLPNARNSFPQEEWAGFAVATRFLGRHGLNLPTFTGETDVERALIHLRALLHAAAGAGARYPARESWAALDRLPPSAVIGCLSEIEAALRELTWYERDTPRISLVALHRAECLLVARQFLDSGEEAQHFHFAYGRDEGPNLAFGIVESFGDRSDIERLRRLSLSSRFARRSLAALRKLDTA